MKVPALNHNTRFLTLIMAVALLVRVGCLLWFPQPFKGDSPGYDRIARNFISGQGLVEDNGLVAHRTPVYPLFLAGLYSLLGRRFTPVYIVQIILDIACLFLTYVLGKNCFNDVRVGLLAAFMYAFYPAFIINSITLLSETIFTLLVLSFIWLTFYAIEKRSLACFFGSGLLLALSALCRPVTLGFFIFLSGYLALALRQKGGRQVTKIVLTFSLAFVLMLLPWVVRNYRITGAFVPSTTSIGHHLFYGQTPIVLQKDLWGETTYPMYYDALKKLGKQDVDRLGEVEADKALKRMAAGVIGLHPRRYALLSVNRFIRLWFNIGYGYPPSFQALLVMFGQLVIVGAVIMAFILFPGRWMRRCFPCVLLVVYFTLVHSLMHAAYRYIVPVMPFMLIFASHTVLNVWKSREKITNAATENA